MTSKALETLANNCPSLSDIRICLVYKRGYLAIHPVMELEGSTLDLGVEALLMKYPRARRLALCFCDGGRFGLSNVVLTDEGLSNIGQYGRNLHMIGLTGCGSSDAALAFIAVGCVKLRVLELYQCQFGNTGMEALAMGCPSLKQLWVQACRVELQGVKLLAQRPGLVVEVVEESSEENRMINPWPLSSEDFVDLYTDEDESDL